MNAAYDTGLDIHKKTISFVIKSHGAQLIRRGSVEGTRPALTAWADQIDQPWIVALEATTFSGWSTTCPPSAILESLGSSPV